MGRVFFKPGVLAILALSFVSPVFPQVDIIGDLIVQFHDPMQSVAVRRVAAISLASWGEFYSDPRGVQTLIDALENGVLADHTQELREAAAYALGVAGDTSAVLPLITALISPNPDIRKNAVRALSAIGDLRAVEPLCFMLHDEDSAIASDAAWELELLVGGTLTDPQPRYPYVSGDAEVLLVTLESTPASDTLLSAISVKSGSIFQAAALLSGVVADHRARDILAASLLDPHHKGRSRFMAGLALARMDDARAVPPLIEAMNDSLSVQEDGAVLALVDMGECAVLPLLEYLKQEPIHPRASRILWVLGNIGDNRAVEVLIPLLKHPSSDVANRSLYALEQITGLSLSPKPGPWRRWWKKNIKNSGITD